MLQLKVVQFHSCSSPLALQNPRFCSPTSPEFPLFSAASSSCSSSSSSYNSAALPPRKKNLSFKCRRSEYLDQQQGFSSATPNHSPFAPQSPRRGGGGGALAPRVFVGHSIYKGKAALTVDPRAPEFVYLDSGAYKLSKEGFVLLQFAPASAIRQYDWSRKQVFSLSVTEIGSLITLGVKESCEFYHDPNKGRSDEGKIRKLLKVEPLPDGSGHFFNLSVQNKLMTVDESIYIPITKAEFAVLISALNFILPYLLGWHVYANSIRPDDPSRSNNTNARIEAELEWGRQ